MSFDINYPLKKTQTMWKNTLNRFFGIDKEPTIKWYIKHC